ncbi:MAG: SDR family oxidoreductase [Desulfobacteraceae bacterium]|nr:SDR family oxidoreductase [Desulfobacteraceae bacterium]
MELKDKVAVVTGGASGIGAALCRAFAKQGARAVAVADLDLEGARQVAGEINGMAVACDVSREKDIISLVEKAEKECGPVDIFCSNAGIIARGGLEVSNEDWQRIWEINVMAHVYAGRAVIDKMIARGGGYFLITASAAGLLSQIGSAPYSVTKHAAVGLAENIAITYGDRGIKVSAICPQAVETKMTREGGGVAAVNGMIGADKVAEDTIEAMHEERFLVLPHTEVATYMQRKTSDYDRWLQGMRRLQARFMESG